jgi:hypothetical protein
MSENRQSYAGIWITGAALLVASLALYVQLLHERDHEGTNYMPVVLSIVLYATNLGLVGWAVGRNIKDANRAKSLHAQIVTIKDDFRTQTEIAAKAHAEELERIRSRASQASALVTSSLKDNAFELVWKLKEFHKSLPPRPAVPTIVPDLTAENADKYAAQLSASIKKWSDQIRHGYDGALSWQVSGLLHKLGSMGWDVSALEEYSRCVETDENVSNVIESLQEIASGLEEK